MGSPFELGCSKSSGVFEKVKLSQNNTPQIIYLLARCIYFLLALATKFLDKKEPPHLAGVSILRLLVVAYDFIAVSAQAIRIVSQPSSVGYWVCRP